MTRGIDRCESDTSRRQKLFEDALQNISFSSNRLWKNQPPDKFDFVYTRLLFHAGEMTQRLSETTASDILNEIGFLGNQKESRMDKTTDASREDKEVQNILQECRREDTFGKLKEPDNAGDNGTNTKTPKIKALPNDEWFTHPKVETIVKEQTQRADDADDQLIKFEGNCPVGEYHVNDLLKIQSAYWNSVKTVGPEKRNVATECGHNTPFDPRLVYRGLLLRKNEFSSFGKDPLEDPEYSNENAPENIFLCIGNISTLTEQHYSKYRTFLRSLSLDQKHCPQLNVVDQHLVETQNIIRGLPITTDRMSPDDWSLLMRIMDDKVRVLWHDIDHNRPTEQRVPGAVRRPGLSRPWMAHTDVDSSSPKYVHDPIFSTGKIHKKPSYSQKTGKLQERSDADSNITTDAIKEFGILRQTYPMTRSTELHLRKLISGLREKKECSADRENMEKRLNPLAMDYFPSFHAHDTISDHSRANNNAISLQDQPTSLLTWPSKILTSNHSPSDVSVPGCSAGIWSCPSATMVTCGMTSGQTTSTWSMATLHTQWAIDTVTSTAAKRTINNTKTPRMAHATYAQKASPIVSDRESNEQISRCPWSGKRNLLNPANSQLAKPPYINLDSTYSNNITYPNNSHKTISASHCSTNRAGYFINDSADMHVGSANQILDTAGPSAAHIVSPSKSILTAGIRLPNPAISITSKEDEPINRCCQQQMGSWQDAASGVMYPASTICMPTMSTPSRPVTLVSGQSLLFQLPYQQPGSYIQPRVVSGYPPYVCHGTRDLDQLMQGFLATRNLLGQNIIQHELQQQAQQQLQHQQHQLHLHQLHQQLTLHQPRLYPWSDARNDISHAAHWNKHSLTQPQ